MVLEKKRQRKKQTAKRKKKQKPIDGLIDRLEREEFDLVGVGRALLTDPEWPNKIRDGRFDELQAFQQEHMLSLS